MSFNSTETELLVRDPEATSNLNFKDGSAVPTTTHIKYLGSMIARDQPFDIAVRHRTALAEEAYKNLDCSLNAHSSKNFISSVPPSYLPFAMDLMPVLSPKLA